MSIDVDCARTRSWSVGAVRTGIIADDRDDHSSIPHLVNDILHVIAIGAVQATAKVRVLIFRLIQDDRTSIRDLGVGNGSSDIGHVTDE